MLDDISRDGDDKLSFLSSNVNFDIDEKPSKKRRERRENVEAEDAGQRVGMANIRKRAVKRSSRSKNGTKRRKVRRQKSTEGMSSLYSYELAESSDSPLPVVELTCASCNHEVDLIHALEQLDDHIETLVARRVAEREDEMRRELVEEFKRRRAKAVASRDE